jgi:broad specificity phosphatase PhoE
MTDFIWPELYFIRHGETDWNAEGRYQGSRDIPLNDRGRGQAAQNGDLLKSLLARSHHKAADFDWYVSPLGRTRETMDRVVGRFTEPPATVTVDPRLIEISFGDYEGRLHTELANGTMAIAGESYADVAIRVADFGASLTGPAVIVSHGGILRVLRALIEGFPRDRAVNWFPPQDSVVHFIDGKSIVYPAGQSWDD